MNSGGIGRFFADQAKAFLLALGFLTRMGPALPATALEMSRACAWYPLVGLALGIVLTVPLSPLHGQDWVCAWLYVALSAWLTRALHLDGFADLLDALGSGRSGEDFQAVLKDSHVGAFGCVGLVLAVAGHILLAAACFSSGTIAPLAAAPVFGRCLPFFLSLLAPPNPKARLGALMADAPLVPSLFLATAGSIGVLALLPTSGIVPLIAMTAICLLGLRRVAQRQGGYNGDFCGFAIVCGELAVLLSAVWQ